MTIGREADMMKDLPLTVNVSTPHPGALRRVRVSGPGAEALLDAIHDILVRYPDAGASIFAEIDRLFEAPKSGKSELIAALDDIIGNAAKARRLLETP